MATFILLSASSAWTQSTVTAPVSSEPERMPSRFSTDVWAGFVTGQDVRALLIETTWTVNRFLSVTPAYANIGTPSATFQQLRGSTTFHVTAGRMMLDNRSLFVRHWAAAGDRTLYRNRLRLTYPFRALGKASSLFVADEPFYDWRAQAWTRNWIYAGGSCDFNRFLTAQVFYLRQQQLSGPGLNTMVYALIIRVPGLAGFKKG